MIYLRLARRWLLAIPLIRIIGILTAVIWWVPYLWSCLVRDWWSGRKISYEGNWTEFLHGAQAVALQTVIYLVALGYVLVRIFWS